MQRLKRFFYLISLSITGNLFADINEEFINLFVNELPCSPEFIEYIENDISMRDDFSFMNNDFQTKMKIGIHEEWLHNNHR